jgi:hypothetical protein
VPQDHKDHKDQLEDHKARVDHKDLLERPVRQVQVQQVRQV